MNTGSFRNALIVAMSLLLLLALLSIINLQKELATIRYKVKEPLLRSIPLNKVSEPLLHRIEASEIAQQTARRPLLMPIVPLSIAPKIDSTDSPDSFLAETRRRAEADPEAAMQWLQNQHSGSERLRGMLEVVALWAAEDSESALLWLESNAQGLARLETLNNGVELWAARNPVAAAEWVDGMANDGSKVTAAKSLVATWAETDPKQASAWVAGLPNGSIRDAAAAALANSWAKEDPEAASIWAFAQAEFNGNTELLISTIQTFTREAPQDAEAFLRDIVEAADAPAILTSHVIARAETDPEATADWLANLSPSDPIYSSEYANSLMQVWAQSDSIAASEWLSQMPRGAQRDAAVAGFSESIQGFEPAAAAAWANTINDPDRRVMRLSESVRLWAASQPVEALEWVKSADLEPDLREKLAREIPWD
jgi:hypothetical protein